MSSFIYLSSIAFFLFAGLIGYLISHRFNLPHSFILISLGIALSAITNHIGFFMVPRAFTESVILVAYILVVFDIFSRFDFTTPTSLHSAVRSFKVLTFFIGLPIMAALSMLVLGFESILIAVLFAALLLPSSRAFLKSFKPKQNRLAHLLEIESVKLTAYVLLITAAITFILMKTGSMFGEGVVPYKEFGMGIVVGIGTGVLCGLIFIHIMKKAFSKHISHLGLVTAILITYTLTEALGGIAIFGVMTLGFLFGSTRIQKKPFLYEFSSLIAEFFEIVVFLLLGFLIAFPLDLALIGKAIIIFALLTTVRYFLITLSVKHVTRPRERIFLALTSPKDITTAIVTLVLFIDYKFQGMNDLLSAIVVVILLSVMFAYITSIFEKGFYDRISGMPPSEM